MSINFVSLKQFGIVKAILHLIKCFSPIHFMSVWEEFNLLEICVTFINQNYVTGTDLTCHRELIDICTNLLAGKSFFNYYFLSISSKIHIQVSVYFEQ